MPPTHHRPRRQIWTETEHKRFMEAVFDLYGCNWRLVTKYIKTRRQDQVRSHAQKVFEKLRATGQDHLIPRRRPVGSKTMLFLPPLETETKDLAVMLDYSLFFDLPAHAPLPVVKLSAVNIDDDNMHHQHHDDNVSLITTTAEPDISRFLKDEEED